MPFPKLKLQFLSFRGSSKASKTDRYAKVVGEGVLFVQPIANHLYLYASGTGTGVTKVTRSVAMDGAAGDGGMADDANRNSCSCFCVNPLSGPNLVKLEGNRLISCDV